MIDHRVASTTIAAAAAVLTLPFAAAAQFRRPPPTPAYALENTTVVHADGRREAGVTIVIRGKLIEAMGPGVTVPPDAKILEGDSLYVYPGFVDAHGTAELNFPEIEAGDDVRSWNGPRDLQGFLAHRRVADHLSQSGNDGKEQRAQGIVAAGIWPDGGLAAGLGAGIVYRTDVARPWDLVANENTGLAMAFKGGRGVYPGTLFGVIAYMRQAFEDARRDGLILAAYNDDPSGLGGPGVDPDYAVLRSAMDGEFPVYFAANGAEDIRRVLQLAEEYGFRPVIVGGQEAWRVSDELARRNIPVLIDGDFPQPDKWKSKEGEEEEEEEDPETEGTPEQPVAAAAPIEPDTLEPEMLEPAAAREKERIENVRANAARLDSAGVTFAITSGGGDASLLEAARISVKYGLPEDAALRAITSTPAMMLGMPHVTQIGQGMAATFVVMTGPIFDDGSEVAHTFVEGGYTEGAGSGGGGEAPAVNVTGDWAWTLSTGGEEFAMEASLKMDDDGSVSGTVTNDMFGSAPIRGRVSGSRLTFTIAISFGGQSMELTGEGTVEGDRLSGSGDGPFGAFSLSGKKSPGGAR